MIRNASQMNTAMIQLGVAAEALLSAPVDLLRQINVAGQDGSVLEPEEALQQLERTLAAARTRLRHHRIGLRFTERH